MNQILVTGEEVIREPVKKQKKVLPVNSIVIFFAISIIILGICFICGSVYSKMKINETVQASIQPEIEIERDDENNKIKINVTHIRGITTLSYQWNDEEKTVVNGNNNTNISKTIDLIGGENTLKIDVTEENGRTKTIEKTFVAGNIPEIALEAVANGVKLIATCEDEISYVEYTWDDEETQKIEVNATQYEGIINAPKGEHFLKVEVISANNMKVKKEQKVIGDTEPTVNVKQEIVNGKSVFMIDVEDDESIATLELIHNGGEKQVIEVNAATYHHEVIMTDGEENTLIIVAINKNGLSKTRGVKFRNY